MPVVELFANRFRINFWVVRGEYELMDCGALRFQDDATGKRITIAGTFTITEEATR